MGIKKKVGKERLDKYYHLAKEQGYRARSAFKLIQLNRKYNFLEKAKVLVDLCAAPGGWLQVAAKHMPMSHVIIGIDLAPIKPIPGVITFKCDITTDKCRSEIRRELKTWKADVFLNDGAPNVGSSWSKDAFSQSELVLSALKLASEFLNKGGAFVTKVFRSKDYNSLMWVFQQLFDKVDATKPASSRNVSAEIFVVCRGYKAPDDVDAKFFDSKFVFQEMDQVSRPINIFKPEKRIRSREGYADGVTLLVKKADVREFLLCEDPKTFLGTFNEILLNDDEINGHVDPEIKECFKDLKVLGKKEYKELLLWRKRVIKKLGITKTEETENNNETENIEIDENEQMIQEIQELAQKESRAEKKEKKKQILKKAKSKLKMQGNIKDIEQTDELFSFMKDFDGIDDEFEGIDDEASDLNVTEEKTQEESDEESDGESKRILELDHELEQDYDSFKRKKMEKDPKYLVKMKRKEEEEEFHGFPMEEDVDDIDEDENDKSDDKPQGKASMFFSQPLFKSLDTKLEPKKTLKRPREQDIDDIEDSDDENIRVDVDAIDQDESLKDTILTPEAITAALAIKRGGKKTELIDESFNRYTFHDDENLPTWFLEDENKHNKPQKPITKEAMDIYRQKLKAIDARPIKKVAEAKARKKYKAMKKIENTKKKADDILNTDMSEKQKLTSIQSMMRKAVKKAGAKKPELVVAKGKNRGVQGRPKGIKGRYKMVDKRLKKDMKAMKRSSKKK